MLNEFQSTHPRGVRPTFVDYDGILHLFQSTHPRGVRPGARQKDKKRGDQVSIHAPAWGATRRPQHRKPYRSGFNPRTRVGCDNVPSSHDRTQEPVSIHAPAWGATLHKSVHGYSVAFQSTHPRGVRHAGPGSYVRRCPSFNPRTRVGCDTRRRALTIARDQFQSTHPRGVRLFPCFIQ